MTPEPDYNTRENKLAVCTAAIDGKTWQWSYDHHKPSWIDEQGIIPHFLISRIYRVKPTPKRVPLEAKDVPPGSVFKVPGENTPWYAIIWVSENSVKFFTQTQSCEKAFKPLMEQGWYIKRPGAEWELCSKEITE